MIGHVWIRSKYCELLDEVYVATPDEEIQEYIHKIGGSVIMTADSHERASDRCAEAMLIIEEETNKRVDVLVMLQGDEPLLHPEMIQDAVDPILQDPSILVTNLLGELTTVEEHTDVNEVKVVVDQLFNALYFSREPIPSQWKIGSAAHKYKQVCIIPFRRDFLLKFTRLEPTPLEITESIDMLRVLEHGYRVKMVPTAFQVYSVDTPDDLRKVDRIMAEDPLFKKYRGQPK
jgi:3-deoxy-manno-octulosonate cytidylyltransferase (CMP-KDO synthetase)